mmetsp:Transcript_26458/g.59912  ORF Transcript_26458/g.59912 Transcript_26458/m.59912 type:complete len:217 (+) Transcript_26458:141-791(+)
MPGVAWPNPRGAHRRRRWQGRPKRPASPTRCRPRPQTHPASHCCLNGRSLVVLWWSVIHCRAHCPRAIIPQNRGNSAAAQGAAGAAHRPHRGQIAGGLTWDEEPVGVTLRPEFARRQVWRRVSGWRSLAVRSLAAKAQTSPEWSKRTMPAPLLATPTVGPAYAPLWYSSPAGAGTGVDSGAPGGAAAPSCASQRRSARSGPGCCRARKWGPRISLW